MDPAKLKVVDLRTELANRGLDTKGVKAVLVARLQGALDEESGNVSGTKNVPNRLDSCIRTECLRFSVNIQPEMY